MFFGFCSVPRHDLVAEIIATKGSIPLASFKLLRWMNTYSPYQNFPSHSAHDQICSWASVCGLSRTTKWWWSEQGESSSFCSACSTGRTKWTWRTFVVPEAQSKLGWCFSLSWTSNCKVRHTDADRGHQVLLSFTEQLGNLWQKLHGINGSPWLRIVSV